MGVLFGRALISRMKLDNETPVFSADLVELFEAQQREKHSSGPIGAHDLVFTGALRVGGDDWRAWTGK